MNKLFKFLALIVCKSSFVYANPTVPLVYSIHFVNTTESEQYIYVPESDYDKCVWTPSGNFGAYTIPAKFDKPLNIKVNCTHNPDGAYFEGIDFYHNHTNSMARDYYGLFISNRNSDQIPTLYARQIDDFGLLDITPLISADGHSADITFIYKIR